jgi:ABC-2 type transport system permease protein
MSEASSSKAPHLVEAKPLTFVDHVVNIFHLVIKELRSIRADPVMLILVIYSFSISVNTVATGAVTEATNLSVGIVDEDGSDLSRQIAEGLRLPTFQPPVQITASDIDPMMDQGKLLFVVEIPPNFEADIRAQRKTGLQINVDATAVAQAGNGASSLRNAIATEIQRFISGRADSNGAPINLVVRAAFNPNLKTAWFSAMTQVINQITMLTVILTGAALIREREQGTVEHLLVMPVVPSEIMLAKMIANGLVILVAAMVSLQFVVHWWIGSPINGSLLVFLLGAAIYALVVAALGILLGTLATTMGQFGLLAMPVLMVTQLLQHADGEHAGLAAVFHSNDQPDAAFRAIRPGGAVPRRRPHACLASAGRDVGHRRCLFHRRQHPLPKGDFRRVTTQAPLARSPTMVSKIIP